MSEPCVQVGSGRREQSWPQGHCWEQLSKGAARPPGSLPRRQAGKCAPPSSRSRSRPAAPATASFNPCGAHAQRQPGWQWPGTEPGAGQGNKCGLPCLSATGPAAFLGTLRKGPESLGVEGHR